MNPIRGLDSNLNGNNNGNGEAPDCNTQMKEMWKKVPFFTRYIFY